MSHEDPILTKIREKQEMISDESRLIKKKETSNLLVIGTSFILLIGIVIGVVRILISL